MHLYIAKVWDIDDYLQNLVSLQVPLDELGLLIVTRMYHGHVAVITNVYAWTSGWDVEVKDCQFIFAYGSGVKFHPICDRIEGFEPEQKKPLNLSKPKSKQLGMDKGRRKRTKSRNKVN